MHFLWPELSATFCLMSLIREIILSFYFCYRPQRSCDQGNIFTPVCYSVHGGGSASVHAGIPPPYPRSRPPRAVNPPGSRHPQSSQPSWEQTPPGSRHPLGADPSPSSRPPLPRKQTPAYGQWAAGTHPTGMHSCLKLFLLSSRNCRTITPWFRWNLLCRVPSRKFKRNVGLPT